MGQGARARRAKINKNTYIGKPLIDLFISMEEALSNCSKCNSLECTHKNRAINNKTTVSKCNSLECTHKKRDQQKDNNNCLKKIHWYQGPGKIVG